MPIKFNPEAKKIPHTFQDCIPERENENTLIKKSSVGAQASMSELAQLHPILLCVLKFIGGFPLPARHLMLKGELVSLLEPCYPGQGKYFTRSS